MGDQPWQQQAGAVHQALDVGVDHGFPVIEVALGRRVSAQGQACVVDQPAQLGERRWQVGDGRFHGLAVTHIEHQAVHFGLLRQLGTQRFQALLTATGQHQRPAGFSKTTGAGFAEAGGCASDEYGRGHAGLLDEADHRVCSMPAAAFGSKPFRTLYKKRSNLCKPRYRRPVASFAHLIHKPFHKIRGQLENPASRVIRALSKYFP
ncbi:hypothetical protein D3C79_721950 [compost metagenome]